MNVNVLILLTSYTYQEEVFEKKNIFIYLIAGVRQEQDIYVRLIDSVTKQVCVLEFALRKINKSCSPFFPRSNSLFEI